MLHYRFERKLILIVGALITASAIFAVVLTPAASEEIRPLLQSWGIISCSGPNPCQEGSNSSTGAGLEGISAKGKGVIGETIFNSTSSSNGQAGVLGIDVSASGAFDTGVRGSSTRGVAVLGTSSSGIGVKGISSTATGVVGISTKANGVVGQVSATPTPLPNAFFALAGVLGQDASGTSPNNVGVAGISNSGVGVIGESTNGFAVGGFSKKSDGVVGVTSANLLPSTNTTSGVLGLDNAPPNPSGTPEGNSGVFGASGRGFGVVGQTISGRAGLVALGTGVSSAVDLPNFGHSNAVYAENSDSAVATIFAQQDNATGLMFSVINTGSGQSATIDSGGNLTITGKIFTGGTCSSGCIVTRSTAGHEITTYSTRGPVPSIEDFGQGTLLSGIGHVAINPDFASIMDPRVAYLVFLTPHGDSRGLYVSAETRAGFEVRENQVGRSTLVFDYRIVAKPFASNEARLPVFHPARMPSPNGPGHSRATFMMPGLPLRP